MSDEYFLEKLIQAHNKDLDECVKKVRKKIREYSKQVGNLDRLEQSVCDSILALKKKDCLR